VARVRHGHDGHGQARLDAAVLGVRVRVFDEDDTLSWPAFVMVMMGMARLALMRQFLGLGLGCLMRMIPCRGLRPSWS
jgi:hypothetical protein